MLPTAGRGSGFGSWGSNRKARGAPLPRLGQVLLHGGQLLALIGDARDHLRDDRLVGVQGGHDKVDVGVDVAGEDGAAGEGVLLGGLGGAGRRAPVDAAEALLLANATEAARVGRAGEPWDPTFLAKVRRDLAFAVLSCTRAVVRRAASASRD